MVSSFFKRHKHVIIYGTALAVLLVLLKWLEWRFVVMSHALDIYSGAIAIVFTGLGIWLALKLARPKVVIVEKTIPPSSGTPAIHASTPDRSTLTSAVPASPATAASSAPSFGDEPSSNAAPVEPADPKTLAYYGLSPRELEVLQLMAEGLSNQEIANRLFVSTNTIKTHSSNIFEKLDVRRRTQAVEKARRLKIISYQSRI